uniref:Uncharacterized protein n=1 Tax=Candidozyma auris TaxID=498019 RepID=A0A0L0NU03_CANAR
MQKLRSGTLCIRGALITRVKSDASGEESDTMGKFGGKTLWSSTLQIVGRLEVGVQDRVTG